MTDSTLSFRQWLKRLRAAHDLTQDALAEQVGCAAQTIRMFESGRRRPSRHMAARLADVLGVAPDDRAAFLRQARAAVGGSDAEPASADHPAAGLRSAGAPDMPPAAPAAPKLDATPLLATKLYIPRPRSDLTPRPRLRARLDAGLARPLAIVAAPAGWGKTTLLADWLAHGHHGRAVAWLTLEAGDAEPALFFRYLTAALQTIAPAFGRTTAHLLRAAQAPPLQTLLPLLVNDLAELPAPSILVLDDYHVVDDGAIHEALAFLLDHLPPQLHLVLATRADPPLPLPRFRARGLLTELRAHDLRFTADEAATVLGAVAGTPFTAAEVGAIAARTEGWIAGIQLAALSLREQPDSERAQFIDAFTGSHRFVVDYLVDEVLSRQRPPMQQFLLQTSILERLCGPLCDAVVLSTADAPAGQASDASGQRMIEALERANLFIVPLDPARRWYRYHHLFAQVLRERLGRDARPVAVAALHQRASDWFERQNLPVDALRHALAAQDWERVSRLLVRHGRAVLVNGDVHAVLGWLDALPAPVLRAQPYLLHLRALALFFTNQIAAAERCLEMVEAALASGEPDDPAQTVRAYARLLQASIARFCGDTTRCVDLARLVLSTLPPDDLPRQVSAIMILASARVAAGDVSADSERQLRAAVAAGHTAGDKTSLLHGIVNLGRLLQRQGRLSDAEAAFREAEALAPAPGELDVLGNGATYYFGLGDLLRERNELDRAQTYLAHGRELVLRALVAEADGIVDGYAALARLQVVRGDAAAAAATLDELAGVARDRNFADHLVTRIGAVRADLALRAGAVDRAARWADTLDLPADPTLSPQREPEYVVLARVRIAQGRTQPAGADLQLARTLLARLIPLAAQNGQEHQTIELLLLDALALHAQHDLPAAHRALEHALSQAMPGGFARIVVDAGAPMAALLDAAMAERAWGRSAGPGPMSVRVYAHTLRELIEAEGHAPAHSAAVRHAGLEPLTARETAVLQLLAAGYSTQAMAAELVVATGTIKRHINNIFGKLQVQSRLEAVARARSLGLV